MGILSDTQSLFSRNMSDIVTSLQGEASAPVVVHSEDHQTMAFVMYAVDDNITIRTSDIVDSLAVPYDPYINHQGLMGRELHRVALETRDEADEFTVNRWPLYVLFGGYDSKKMPDEYAFLQHNFLTWRPQTDYVVPGIKQQLSFVICNNGADAETTYPSATSRRLCAKIYFRTQQPVVKELATATDNVTIYRLDCSYNKIAALVAEEVDDEVVAYDIYGATDDDTSCIPIKPQRFIVRPQSSSFTHFLFQNSLGGFDTITATGELMSIATGEIITARARKIESEVNNGYVKSWEVNTGYIITMQEENLWHEFLRSTNRYILFEDGLYRKIIVEEYTAERATMEADSFTFKFHYAEAAEGGYAEKEDSLPDFFIE